MKGVCQICKSEEISSSEIDGYWFCKDCHATWLIHQPRVSYGKNYYKSGSNIAATLFSPIAYGLYLLRQLYVGFTMKNLWIDVGAGDGGFLKTTRASRKIGVEVSVAGRKTMEEKGLETMTETKFLKTKGLKADVISFWHVLEHTKHPWKLLVAAEKNLSFGGKVVVGIPNVDSLEFAWFGRRWFHFQYPFHFWHLSPKSISKLLKNSGFRVEKIDYWSPEHHLAGVLQSFINRFADNENVLQKILKRKNQGVALTGKDVFWSLFWLTVGFPIVILYWVLGSVLHKSGTIVIVAVKKKRG